MTRKSKREIEQRIEELDGDSGKEEFPVLREIGLILKYEWESVEGHDNLVRRKDNGEIYRRPEGRKSLAEVIGENEEESD
jgi:hypothetical protein